MGYVDKRRANTIANYVLGRSLDELSPSSRKLLMLVKQMCKEKAADHHFSRRQIIEHRGWSDFHVRTHIRQLQARRSLHIAQSHSVRHV